MRKIVYLLAMFSAIGYGTKAQSVGPTVLNSTGGSGSVVGNLFDWSVGEMSLVNTASGSNIIVTQGLLQPSDVPTGIANNPFTQSSFVVYPNPAEDQVFLQPSFSGGDQLMFTLMDVTGRTLLTQNVKLPTGKELQTINLTGLAAGNYLLQVQLNQKGDNYSTSYKIQKLH